MSDNKVEFVPFDNGGAPVRFGKDLRKEFMLDFENVEAFCNQGGIGVCPRRVVEYRHDLFNEMESNPDLFSRHKRRPYYDEALAAAAEFLGSKKENLVFVPNVTSGLNAAVRAVEPLILESKANLGSTKPKILTNYLTYHATGFMAEHLAERTGAEVVVADIDFPIKSEEDAVNRFKEAYLNTPDIVVAIIDHISSASAVFWPLAKIVKALKALGVKRIIVDGAHAPGQVADLNLEYLGSCGVDYYSGNLHKWGMAPRGCAVLWCRPELQDQAYPNNTSHYHYLTFQDRYFEQGTMDYSNYVAVPAALSFIKALGGVEAIQANASQLLDWAQEMLAKAFGTETLPIPKNMEAPYMRCIALPEMSGIPEPDFDTSMTLTEEVVAEYGVGTYLTGFAGRYWVRISAGAFNEKEDYTKLMEALVDKCAKHK